MKSSDTGIASTEAGCLGGFSHVLVMLHSGTNELSDGGTGTSWVFIIHSEATG